MITINLDRSKREHLYLQLYEKIKKEIIEGRLEEGKVLPSKRTLASHLDISIKTVENAYYQLMLEGYIYSKDKSGYYVNRLTDYNTKKKKLFTQSKYIEKKYEIDLKANKNDLSLFPVSVWNNLTRQALSDASEDLQYLDTIPFNGQYLLRVAIANYLLQFRGLEVSPDQIIVGSGTEYLYGRLIHLLGSSASYAMEDPGYNHIRTIYKNHNVSYQSIPVDESGICIEKLEESGCNIVHLSPSQHFPLGTVMPIQRRVELLKWVNAKAGRYIIEDDYNCEYRYHGNPVSPIFDIDVMDKVIYMNTFSKSIASAIRVSYLVLPEKLMERYIRTRSFYSCTVPNLHQLTLAAFLNKGHLERMINRTKRFNVEQRKRVMEVFEKSDLKERCELITFSAGTHFLLKLQTTYKESWIVEELKKRGILVSFVSEYCEESDNKYRNLMIINYSRVTRKQFEKFLVILNEMISK